MSEIVRSELGTESEVPALPTTEKGMQRRVFGLAWPVIGENMLETLLGVVDTLLVGLLGAAALAGVGSALQVMFFLISALSALGVGSSVLVAQAVGAKDTAQAGGVARHDKRGGGWKSAFSKAIGRTCGR